MILEGRIRILSVAIALTFLGGTLALAFPRGDTGRITVTAVFPKTIGLFPQSHVRVLGVSVGRVHRIEPAGNVVKVVMRIDASRKIPAGARAVVVPISLIADRYIQLTPTYDSGPVLQDGAVIPADRTAIPAELDDVLAQLKKLLDAVEAGTAHDPESIGLAVKNLASALAGSGDDFSRGLEGGGELAGSIAANAAEVDAIAGHLANLASALAERRSDIASLNTNLSAALGAIASQRSALDGALSNVALLTEQLGSLVKEHRPALEQDLAVLAKTTKIVMEHQDSLIRGLEWLHVLADGAEAGHNGGAIHKEPGKPTHIDVRDAHLFACPPPPVPSVVCLLLGLTGGLPAGVPAAPGTPGAAPGASPGGEGPLPDVPPAPDPLDLLDLLPGLSSPTPVPGSLPGGMPGLLGGALGWLL